MNFIHSSKAPVTLGALITESLARNNAQAAANNQFKAITDILLAALRAEVGKRGRCLVIDDDMTYRMAKVTEWLTTDTRPFLMLCGGCGNGKTTMMRAIAAVVNALGIPVEMLQGSIPNTPQNTPHKGMYTAPQSLVHGKYKESHASGIPNEGKTPQQTILTMREELATELGRKMKYDYPDWKAACNAPLLGIDDLGEEPLLLRSYGNYLRPMTELLQWRYDKQLTTVITTNLTPRQIGETYGERIADRLAEAVKVVPFKSPSFRGMKTQPETSNEQADTNASEQSSEYASRQATEQTSKQAADADL